MNAVHASDASNVVALAPVREGHGSLDDDALMLLAASGDVTAFSTIVRRHEQAVRRFLSRLVGTADAPDLAQECFVRLWQARARYRAEGRFTVFLYRVARNLAYSKLRWRKLRSWIPIGPRDDDDDHQGAVDPKSTDPDALALALGREESRLMGTFVARLRPELRDVLVLRHAEGLDYKTIAGVLGISEVNARARACRGLAALKDALQERKDTEARHG